MKPLTDRQIDVLLDLALRNGSPRGTDSDGSVLQALDKKGLVICGQINYPGYFAKYWNLTAEGRRIGNELLAARRQKAAR